MAIGARCDGEAIQGTALRNAAMHRLARARALVPLVGSLSAGAPDPVRAAQVELLRNAVAAGRYQPDPRAVARALLVHLRG